MGAVGFQNEIRRLWLGDLAQDVEIVSLSVLVGHL